MQKKYLQIFKEVDGYWSRMGSTQDVLWHLLTPHQAFKPERIKHSEACQKLHSLAKHVES